MGALAANPAFTLTAMAVLAIGIGANSAMFSLVNAVLLRPVPWEDPDRLVLVQEVQRESGDNINPSTANYVDWRGGDTIGVRFRPESSGWENRDENAKPHCDGGGPPAVAPILAYRVRIPRPASVFVCGS